MKFAIKVIFFSFLFLNTPLFSGIVNTKHNLSITGSGTVKAQTETAMCAFCHIPHTAMPEGKPLWNRSMPTSIYTMYNSDYLKRMLYTVESDLGSTNDTPGALSRQCLSCHDGTVAIGAVHALHSTLNPIIAMDGVEGDGTLLSSSAGFIGTDLSMHHPVGIEYDPTVIMSFGTGSRTIELKAIPDSPLKLFEYGGKKYVECSSCHDPHKENNMFLHVDSGANHAQNVVNTCTSCHEKIDWIGSVHQAPPSNSPDYTDTQVLADFGTAEVAEMGCANCHTPHNANGIPYLNRQVQEQTCFQGAASDTVGAACHGDNAGTAVNIETVANRTYAHPIISANNPDGSHTNLDVLYGEDEPVDPNGGKGVAWSNNKHAVCMDCHNPHKAKKGTHVTDGTWYGIPSANTNNVSPALEGVTGVEPTWPTEWTQPTAFTTLESSTKEYQICFKCHSYWGLGTTLSATNPATTYPSVSDPFSVPITDVAWEMNINNKSGHPVVIQNNLRGGTSYEPKALPAAALLSPWNNNPGGNTMYCSDCHGADNELGGDPKGPHGSDLKFMLKGENQYWPTNPDGATLYNLRDINKIEDSDLFCKNCHDISVPHRGWIPTMANMNISCVGCHVAVPHGSPVSRLIGYDTFPEPYNYNGNSLALQGWRKNSIDNLSDAFAPGCWGCHSRDQSHFGAYDRNPFNEVQDFVFDR